MTTKTPKIETLFYNICMVQHKPGDFSFIEDSSTRNSLEKMYSVINQLELWHTFDKEPGEFGYHFSTNRNIEKIMTICDEHSGNSANFCLRHMRFIHINGWDLYVCEITKKRN